VSRPRFARNYRRATHALKLRHVYRIVVHYASLPQFYIRGRIKFANKIVCEIMRAAKSNIRTERDSTESDNNAG